MTSASLTSFVLSSCVLVLATMTAAAHAALLTFGQVLRIDFATSANLPTPLNTFLLTLGQVDIDLAVGVRRAALFDSTSLLGEDDDARFGGNTGVLSLVPSNAWKTAGSPYTGGTTAAGLDVLFDGTTQGRVAFTIETGQIELDLDQVRLELLAANSCCGGEVGNPAPTITAMQILVLEPADYNLDGGVTATDLSFWESGYGTTVGAQRTDGDSDVDADADGADFLAWQRQLSFLESADFNLDSRVSAADLSFWESGYGTADGARRTDGDSNADRDVDGADFLNWQRQLSRSNNLALLQIVPEPTARMMVCVAMAIAAVCRRHRLARVGSLQQATAYGSRNGVGRATA